MQEHQADPVRIVQLSDLHFGLPGQRDIWDSLAAWLRQTLRPDLMLVTGDIVDSPKKDLFHDAKDALDNTGIRYYVCAGNHDTYKKGNALGRFFKRSSLGGNSPLFYATFRDAYHGCDNSAIFEATSKQWKLRIFSLDTSEHAVYSAQGYLRLEDIEAIERATRDTDDADLVIALVHHHLLPIAGREATVQQRTDLLQLTTMLNAGTLLGRLVREHVDLVLHGHEHCQHLARYGVADDRTSDLVVLGAASATGAETLKPCNHNNACSNLLELHSDRSVLLKEIKFHEGQWTVVEPGRHLFDAQRLQRSRVLRETREKSVPTSRVVKHIEMTHDRDGVIHEHRTEWLLEPTTFTIKAVNSTGTPLNPAVSVDFGFGPRALDIIKGHGDASDFVPLEEGDHVWGCKFNMSPLSGGDNLPISAKRIDISYVWERGCLLTQSDLSLLQPARAGIFRREQMEFGTLRAAARVKMLTLCVSLPKAYRPNSRDVFVYRQDPGDDHPTNDEKLRRVLEESFDSNGSVRYSLTITYPRQNTRFFIAWKVPPRRALTEIGAAFVDSVRKGEFNFAQGFGERLVNSRLPKGVAINSSVALYVDKSEQEGKARPRIERVNWWAHASAPQERQIPPEEAALGSERMLLTQAWWGSSIVAIGGAQKSWPEVEEPAGMLPGEKLVAVLPVGTDLEGREEVPWGVLRLGFREGDWRNENPRNILLLQTVFNECMFSTLSEFFARR